VDPAFRAPLALRSASALTDSLTRAAIIDFEDIFRARLFPSTALIYKSSAGEMRPMLLDPVCDYVLEQRLVFRHFLKEQGLTVDHRCFPGDDR
jgi:hypothetical protein